MDVSVMEAFIASDSHYQLVGVGPDIREFKGIITEGSS